MVVFLHHKRLESPLPHVTGTLIMPMITANMSRHQPLHPGTQVPIAIRPQHQMKMVGHQTPGYYPHRDPLHRFAQHFGKSQIVLVLVKNLRSSVTSIDHIITHIPNACSCCSWHNMGILPPGHWILEKKVLCPLFPLFTFHFSLFIYPHKHDPKIAGAITSEIYLTVFAYVTRVRPNPTSTRWLVLEWLFLR